MVAPVRFSIQDMTLTITISTCHLNRVFRDQRGQLWILLHSVPQNSNLPQGIVSNIAYA